MRWPLSLLFRGDRGAPAAPDPGAPVGPPDPGAPASRDAAHPAAWRSLPVVQRAAGEMPLTVPALPFVRDLAVRHAPAPILQPLAHDVRADGPAGVVSGLAVPLVHPTSAEPVRAEAPELPAPGAPATRQRRGPGEPPVSQAGLVANVAAGGQDAAALAPPSRSLPSVPPAGAVPALGATRVASSTVGDVPRAVAPAAGADVQRVMSPPPPSASAGKPAHSDEGATGATAARLSGASAAASVQRRTLGELRRLGLGAPLASRPAPSSRATDTPALPLAHAAEPGARAPGRPGMDPAVASASPARLPVLRLAGSGHGAEHALAGAPGPGEAGRPSERVAARDGDAQRAPEDRPLVGDAGRGHPAPAAVPQPAADHGGETAAEAGSPAGEILPLAARPGGAEHAAVDGPPGPLPVAATERAAVPPLAGGASARATSGAAPARAPSTPSAPTTSAPLVVSRAYLGTRAPIRPSVAPMPAAAVPVVARWPSGMPLDGTPPVAAGGHEPRDRWQAAPAATPPADAHIAGRAGPSDAGAAGERPTRATPSASTAAVQRRSPGGSAAAGMDAPAFPSWGAPGRPAVHLGSGSSDAARPPAAWMPLASPAPPDSATSGTPSPTVSRLATGGRPSAPVAPQVGWSPSTSFGPVPAPAGPGVQRVAEIGEVSSEVGGPGGAGQGEGQGGQDYEEIAERVYDRIRSRFATELLLDRERMGLLIDG